MLWNLGFWEHGGDIADLDSWLFERAFLELKRVKPQILENMRQIKYWEKNNCCVGDVVKIRFNVGNGSYNSKIFVQNFIYFEGFRFGFTMQIDERTMEYCVDYRHFNGKQVNLFLEYTLTDSDTSLNNREFELPWVETEEEKKEKKIEELIKQLQALNAEFAVQRQKLYSKYNEKFKNDLFGYKEYKQLCHIDLDGTMIDLPYHRGIAFSGQMNTEVTETLSYLQFEFDKELYLGLEGVIWDG